LIEGGPENSRAAANNAPPELESPAAIEGAETSTRPHQASSSSNNGDPNHAQLKSLKEVRVKLADMRFKEGLVCLITEKSEIMTFRERGWRTREFTIGLCTQYFTLTMNYFHNLNNEFLNKYKKILKIKKIINIFFYF
jgi:hypothetical protein